MTSSCVPVPRQFRLPYFERPLPSNRWRYLPCSRLQVAWFRDHSFPLAGTECCSFAVKRAYQLLGSRFCVTVASGPMRCMRCCSHSHKNLVNERNSFAPPPIFKSTPPSLSSKRQSAGKKKPNICPPSCTVQYSYRGAQLMACVSTGRII